MSYRWDYRNKPFLCRIWMLIIITSISCMDISGCDSPMFFQIMNQKVKEELKQEFVQKLYGEFSTYREHLLSENPTDLIAEAYKIETFSSLYEVLLAKSAQLSDVALLNLLNMSSGILEGMYRKWLGVKDHSYQELEEYVGHEVEDLEGYDLPEAV